VSHILFRVFEDQDYQQRPNDVKLFFNAQRPQMQQRIASNVSIVVALFVKEQSEVRTEHDGRVQSLKAEVLHVRKAIELADEPQHKHEDDYQRRKDSFDSPYVKVDNRKFLFEDFFDDDLSDQITRNHKENVDADEAARHTFRKRMIYQNDHDSDGSDAIDFWSICDYMSLSLNFPYP